MIHHSLHLEICLLPNQLQILLLEVLRIDVCLSLALRYFDFDLFVTSVEVKAIAFAHWSPISIENGCLKIGLLQFIVQFETLRVILSCGLAIETEHLGLISRFHRVSVRIHFSLNHVHDTCCHIIKHLNEPGLAFSTRWGHVNFNEPQREIFVNHKVKSVQLE